MEIIEWKPEFEVGIKEIDAQHKKLVGLINDLIIQTDCSDPSKILSVALDEIYKYTVYHFEIEEQFMKKNDFEFYSEHKKEHIAFVKKFSDLCIADHELTPSEVISFLKEWLLTHILSSDMELKSIQK